MENLHGFHFSTGYSEHFSMASPLLPSTSHHVIPSIWTPRQFLHSDSSSAISDAVAETQIVDGDEVSKALRDKIASHPLYPKLVVAYIDCQKVGATPEMAKLFDEIGRETNFLCERSACLAADLELDYFMVTYCDLLVKYKLDLSRPFNEATAFLEDMEAQLNSLCNGPSRNYNPVLDKKLFSSIMASLVMESVKNKICELGKEYCASIHRPYALTQLLRPYLPFQFDCMYKATGSTEVELRRQEKEADEGKKINEDRELKDKLIRRYGGYITGLKHEFSKRKKKEKLPKEAIQVLLAWWNIHCKWPYPTEEDKIVLAEWTGLDQKQINNWFINRRKRHWKPSEEMQAAAALDGLYGPFYMSD